MVVFMDSLALQAFKTIAVQGSFSRAAEELVVSKPALVHRIRLLENQLKTRLFDRTGRHLTLTVAGQQLLPKATAMLEAMSDLDTVEDTADELTKLSGSVEGKLSIGVTHHIGLHRLPDSLRLFIERYPQVELDIKFDEAEAVYDGLLQGHWQLGITTLNPDIHPHIEQKVIWQDQMKFVAAPDHPLSLKNKVSLSELSNYPALLTKPKSFTRELLEKNFSAHNLKLDTNLSTNNLDTIQMMVSLGRGWSLLPDHLINQNLDVIAKQSKPIIRQLGCVWHRQTNLSNAAVAFIELLQAP
jgi:DNA-binding transcriptional LysR family regulator